MTKLPRQGLQNKLNQNMLSFLIYIIGSGSLFVLKRLTVCSLIKSKVTGRYNWSFWYSVRTRMLNRNKKKKILLLKNLLVQIEFNLCGHDMILR